MIWWPLIVAALSRAMFAYIALTGAWRTRYFTIDEDTDPTGFAIPKVMYGGGCAAMVGMFLLLNWSQIARMF